MVLRDAASRSGAPGEKRTAVGRVSGGKCDDPKEPVGFHRKATSETLALSGPGQAVAMRRGIKRGIAIGRAPCRHRSGAGWVFVVCVKQVNWDHFSSGLWVGLTASTPQFLIELLSSGSLDFAADVPDSCVVGGEGVLWDGLECTGVDWHTGKLEMGDEIRVSMSVRGNFRVTLNGKTVVSVNKVYLPQNKPLYPLVELHGSTEAVELLVDDLPISPPSQFRQTQAFEELDLEPREDALVYHEHPRTPPHAHTPPAGAIERRQQMAMASDPDEASPQASPAATPEAWALPGGASSIRSGDRSLSNSPARRSRGVVAKPASAGTFGGRGERARSPPKTGPANAARQRSSGAASATAARSLRSSTAQQRTTGTATRHSEELPSQVSPASAVREQGRIPNGGPSDWRAQARVWSTVDDCLAHPHKHSENFYAMCRELAATRAERDTVEAKYEEQKRQAAKDTAVNKRREMEIRKMREELHEQAAKLEESISAIEVLSKRTAAAQEAKNRAQHEAWQLKSQLETDQKRSEKLDKKVSHALASAEQAASVPAPGGAIRNEMHLRHLEATFESALSEIRTALHQVPEAKPKPSTLASTASSAARVSGRAAGAPGARTSPAARASPGKGASSTRNTSASPKPARRSSAGTRQRPPRGPGNPTSRKSEERPRPLAMSTSAESLSVADESTTCSSPRAGSGSAVGAAELPSSSQAILQGAALLRPEAGNTPTSTAHWAWPGDVITASQSSLITVTGDSPTAA